MNLAAQAKVWSEIGSQKYQSESEAKIEKFWPSVVKRIREEADTGSSFFYYDTTTDLEGWSPRDRHCLVDRLCAEGFYACEDFDILIIRWTEKK